MMGRPSVRYVFTPDRSLDLDDYIEEIGAPPAAVAMDTTVAGTKTTHDDGSAEYQVTDDGLDITVKVGPDGILTGAHATAPGMDATLEYTYGPQQVTLPTAAQTVGATTLATAARYLHMPAAVRKAAVDGAAATRKAARGRTVQVSQLRTKVRSAATSLNRAAGLTMVKAANVRGGVRVSATNPWTRKTVAYTVKASGKKVNVKASS
jgi:hypothetical protein